MRSINPYSFRHELGSVLLMDLEESSSDVLKRGVLAHVQVLLHCNVAGSVFRLASKNDGDLCDESYHN